MDLVVAVSVNSRAAVPDNLIRSAQRAVKVLYGDELIVRSYGTNYLLYTSDLPKRNLAEADFGAVAVGGYCTASTDELARPVAGAVKKHSRGSKTFTTADSPGGVASFFAVTPTECFAWSTVPSCTPVYHRRAGRRSTASRPTGRPSSPRCATTSMSTWSTCAGSSALATHSTAGRRTRHQFTPLYPLNDERVVRAAADLDRGERTSHRSIYRAISRFAPVALDAALFKDRWKFLEATPAAQPATAKQEHAPSKGHRPIATPFDLPAIREELRATDVFTMAAEVLRPGILDQLGFGCRPDVPDENPAPLADLPQRQVVKHVQRMYFLHHLTRDERVRRVAREIRR